jgi:dinuclear metal center YbgI/SA1388 family protein
MAAKRISRRSSVKLTSKSSMTVSDLARILEARAPSATAESWDNVGLLVGNPQQKISRALLAIDASLEALEEARRIGAQVMINHHPCIFPKDHGLSRVVSGELAFEAARMGIAIIAAHTNFDRCATEVSELLSKKLNRTMKTASKEQWTAVSRLYGSSDLGDRGLYKLVTFVPDTHLEAVLTAVSAAGGGKIGNYDQCSFSVSGVGTFRPGQGANPFLGRLHRRESASEHRLEMIFPRGLKGGILRALKKAHPYEEPAIDLLPVEPGSPPHGIHRGLGYGVILEWSGSKGVEQAQALSALRKIFGVSALRINSPINSRSIQKSKRINRLGFVAGKGSSFISSAIAQNCDAYVTGELDYHESMGAQRRGLLTIETGHSESELFFSEVIQGWIRSANTDSQDLGVFSQLDAKVFVGHQQMNLCRS